MPEFKENVLPDDYPVFCGYLYVADGKVVASDVKGTVADLKRDVKAAEVRRCDIVGRCLRSESTGAETEGGAS